MVALPTRHALILDWSDGFRLAVYLLVAGVIATLHASRERARHEAWQTEQRLAFALNHAHMGAWYSDLKSGKFWWSEGMEKLFGRPPGDFSGTYEGFIGYIHPDDQDFVRRAVTRSVEHGQQFEIEHRIVCPNGQTRWILTRGQIIHDEAGKPWQMIGLAMDDTGRKESAAGAAGGTRGAATA